MTRSAGLAAARKELAIRAELEAFEYEHGSFRAEELASPTRWAEQTLERALRSTAPQQHKP